MPTCKPDEPKGAWEWARGPKWWRQCPEVVKAISVVSLAFSAGMAFFAWGSAQMEVPALLNETVVRVDTLEGWRSQVDQIIPRFHEDHALLNETRETLDSLSAVTRGMWCVARANAHGLNPLLECYVPRPDRRNEE